MKLLDPQKVAYNKTKDKQDQQRRVEQLNKAETEAAVRLNLTVKQSIEKEQLLTQEFNDFKEKIEVEKQALLREVASLENRRKDALRPIEQIRKEAEEIYQQNTEAAQRIQAKEEELVERESDLLERAAALTDRKEDIKEKLEELNIKFVQAKEVEARLKVSTETLSKNWLEYHKAVNEFKHDTNIKELEIIAREKMLFALKEILDKQKEDQEQDRRAIKDGYSSLEKAKKEIYGTSEKRSK